MQTIIKLIIIYCLLCSFIGASAGCDTNEASTLKSASGPAMKERGKDAEPDREAESFFKSIKYGDTQRVRRMLAKRHDLATAVDYRGETPLHLAARSGKGETVNFPPPHSSNGDITKLLIAGGAPLEGREKKEGLTPLHLAARFGNREVAEVLISNGALIDARSDFDSTPLHEATLQCRKDLVALLLKKGADVNARDHSNSTPLLIAVGAGKTDIVRLLLMYNADVTIRNVRGYTPLKIAQQQGLSDISRPLREHGAKD
jgi:ankyrin repeat protein